LPHQNLPVQPFPTPELAKRHGEIQEDLICLFPSFETVSITRINTCRQIKTFNKRVEADYGS
jgi:hypothetical protein